MSGPRPGATGSIIDAYRADAAERETLLRTVEKRNRIFAEENACLVRELMREREGDGVNFIWGVIAGACVFGAVAAIDQGDHDAMLIWGSLAALFIGVRVVLRLRGKRA